MIFNDKTVRTLMDEAVKISGGRFPRMNRGSNLGNGARWICNHEQRVFLGRTGGQEAAAFLLGIIKGYESTGAKRSDFSHQAESALFPNPRHAVNAALDLGWATADNWTGQKAEIPDDGVTRCGIHNTSAHARIPSPAVARVRLTWIYDDASGGRSEEVDVCDACLASKRAEFAGEGPWGVRTAGGVTVLKRY